MKQLKMKISFLIDFMMFNIEICIKIVDYYKYVVFRYKNKI
jgi:hypothetical protein